MGWLKVLFGGYNPDTTRETMRLTFRHNLRRARSTSTWGNRIDAAANALANRYRSQRDTRDFLWVTFEVLPFAFLTDAGCEAALAEYVAWKEHANGSDVIQLRAEFRRGLRAFLSEAGTDTAALKVSFFRAIDEVGPSFAWAIWLDEDLLGSIHDAMVFAVRQLEGLPLD